MSYTLNHASSRQIVRDYTHLGFGIKRLMHDLRIANGSYEFKFIFSK
ncbi:hypothetical protein DLR11_13575 [Salmonella enterica subsp. salamae]|uniref:Uncharacterized protein n=2 Tax=Salmonella enterica subsp. salamae TaxID=59202 RepID=A0A6C7CKN3_SALER|nr:hypothetical protein [Salmonella enterica]ECC1479645.1 hypothetical protein [Salmonella enterica subsp. salamae]EHM1749873.1 hypothetical protein [Salmonella enterica subsp. salamae serovar 40:c:e,n,x,z15]HCM1915632.1 hypothetical protein [Salmonella enterica subsp. salamae serovar 28:r:e,n,z15]HCM1997253.1 hypothetical protein [Salmonella enterica subsp. salamae serovar [1],40:z35:e,n,x,z15]ASG89856.1 hypothetical protein LFZ47_21185 [Salmonella enterica subsp. salamae serovar 55:k:z39 str